MPYGSDNKSGDVLSFTSLCAAIHIPPNTKHILSRQAHQVVLRSWISSPLWQRERPALLAPTTLPGAVAPVPQWLLCLLIALPQKWARRWQYCAMCFAWFLMAEEPSQSKQKGTQRRNLPPSGSQLSSHGTNTLFRASDLSALGE